MSQNAAKLSRETPPTAVVEKRWEIYDRCRMKTGLSTIVIRDFSRGHHRINSYRRGRTGMSASRALLELDIVSG